MDRRCVAIGRRGKWMDHGLEWSTFLHGVLLPVIVGSRHRDIMMASSRRGPFPRGHVSVYHLHDDRLA